MGRYTEQELRDIFFDALNFFNEALVQQRIKNKAILHSERYSLVSPFKGFRREIILFNKTSDTCS